MDTYLSVEIGGTKQQVALGHADGTLIKTITGKPALSQGAADILSWLKTNIDELLSRPDTATAEVKKIFVGFGGPLESSTGTVLSSLQVSGWNDFPLKDWFERTFSLPTVVLNDTVAGGFGELEFGAGQDSTNFFYTNIGTGIGGSVFLNRTYYDGLGTGAAYLGNTWIPDWTSEHPGAVTKVENICAGPAIVARLNRKNYVPASSILSTISAKITSFDLQKAVEQKDTFACLELDRIAESFSIALANCLTLYSVDTIAIGGGIANIGDPLFSRIRKFTENYAFIANKKRYKIQQSRFKDSAVLVGGLAASKYYPPV
jgi:glucokinase